MPDEITALASSVSFSGYDIWVAIGLIAVILIFLFTAGKDYAITLLMSVYIAIVTIFFVPVLVNFNFDLGIEDYQVKLILFVLLIAFFFWLQARNEYFEPYTVPSAWENAIIGFVVAGMMLYGAGQLIPLDMVGELNPLLQTVFLQQPATNIWIILPVAAMLLLRGRT